MKLKGLYREGELKKSQKISESNIVMKLTLPNWISWGTILSTVEDGMANPTPADVPEIKITKS